MIIRVKFMTKPGEKFVVRKLVCASICELCEEAGITFAHKEATVRIAETGKRGELTEQEKQAATAPARSVLDAEAEQLGVAIKSGDGC